MIGAWLPLEKRPKQPGLLASELEQNRLIGASGQ